MVGDVAMPSGTNEERIRKPARTVAVRVGPTHSEEPPSPLSSQEKRGEVDECPRRNRKSDYEGRSEDVCFRLWEAL
jgi:hypothetical protein